MTPALNVVAPQVNVTNECFMASSIELARRISANNDSGKMMPTNTKNVMVSNLYQCESSAVGQIPDTRNTNICDRRPIGTYSFTVDE